MRSFNEERLEFNKNVRKYSPEVDMGRVLIQQSQLKQSVSKYSQSKHVETRPGSNLRSSHNLHSAKEKGSSISSSNDYNSVGNKGKHLQKKRVSEISY